MNNKFRPQDIPKAYIFKQRLAFGRNESYNWQTRIRWYREGDRNKKHLIRVFGQLHYLGSHAPLTIRKRWRIIEQRFLDHRIPKNASMRYINEYSGGRWL